MRIWMLNVLNRMLRNEFECWNNSIAQSHHHSSLNWMTVLQTCCIFCEFERHKFRFDWRQCKIECLENEIEWQMGCAWPKSSKLNAHKMNLVDKITKWTWKTYTKINGSDKILQLSYQFPNLLVVQIFFVVPFQTSDSIVILKMYDVLFYYLLTLFSECYAMKGILRCISFTYQE